MTSETHLREAVVRFRALAVRMAAGLVGDADRAEDLFQEVAASTWARVQREELDLDSEVHARNYLLRAIRNRAVDELRRPTPETTDSGSADAPVDPRDPDAASDPAVAALTGERSVALVRRSREVAGAIERLQPAEREVVELRYGQGLTYREIAERTGTAISTLQARVEAGLAKIRSRIGKGAGRP